LNKYTFVIKYTNGDVSYKKRKEFLAEYRSLFVISILRARISNTYSAAA